jgi:hypothetical protein
LISVGNDVDGNGTLNISGTADVASDDDILIGNNGVGVVNMTGGTISRSGWIVLGNEVGSSGTFHMSGGTVNQSGTEADLEVGDAGTGLVVHSGGTIHVAHDVSISNSGGAGQYNLSGTVNSASPTASSSDTTARHVQHDRRHDQPCRLDRAGRQPRHRGDLQHLRRHGQSRPSVISRSATRAPAVLNQSGGTFNVAGSVLIA